MLRFLLLLSCCVTLAAPAAARPGQGSVLPERGGSLLLQSDEDEPWLAPQVATEVEAHVSGRVARVRVEQVFENPGEHAVEAVYAFPLPPTAAVDRLELRIGEREIHGHLRARAAAASSFERAADGGRVAALVTSERPNLFTTTVANIGPGELVRVRLSYQQIVRSERGVSSLTFPATITPRHASPRAAGSWPDDAAHLEPEAARVADAVRLRPPVLLDGSGPLLDVQVTLDGEIELASVDSSSHALDVQPEGGRIVLRTSEGPVVADRDFRLSWRPAPGGEPGPTLLEEKHAGERYGLWLAPPPDLPGRSGAAARELTLVVDTSRSMAGRPLAEALGLVRAGLEGLGADDRFNLVAGDVRPRPLFEAPRPATAGNVAAALAWTARLSAEGGTHPGALLALAFAAPPSPDHLAQVVLISDGAVSEESDLFRFVRDARGARRLYTLGVGAAPNHHLLRGAARAGGGTFVEPSDEPSAPWATLAAPVLSGVTVTFRGPGGALRPRPLGDVPAGEPLLLLAQLAPALVEATISGELAGQLSVRDVPLGVARAGKGLHQLWALAQLESRGESGAPPRELEALALRHGIASSATSFVAVDVERSVRARAPRASVASALPAGSRLYGEVEAALPRPSCALGDLLRRPHPNGAAAHVQYGPRFLN